MQNTKTHNTKITDTKMQETTGSKSVSGTGVHPSTAAPKVISSPSKGIKALKHGSHKVEYRKDHPRAAAVINTPPSPVLK
jgi:hypothetical protein